MEGLDVKQITAEVAARHGILLKGDDPALLLVTINELVLERSLDVLEARIRRLMGELQQSVGGMQRRVASELSEEVRASARTVREEMQRDIDAAKLETRELVLQVRHAYSRSSVRRWVAAGTVCGLVLVVLGAVLSRILQGIL
jgi:hypothetical protein